MRMTLALALVTTLGIAQPSLAQTAATPGNSLSASPRDSSGAGTPMEGRAATHDEERSGSPNGSGNALEGPNHAPDATRNNGQ